MIRLLPYVVRLVKSDIQNLVPSSMIKCPNRGVCQGLSLLGKSVKGSGSTLKGGAWDMMFEGGVKASLTAREGLVCGSKFGNHEEAHQPVGKFQPYGEMWQS